MCTDTPSRLARQTHSGGMIRKHCGWEAVIWHPPANARPQLRLTQAQMPQGVSQPTLVPCLLWHANRCLKQRHLTDPHYLFYQTEAGQISHRECRRTCHVTCIRSKTTVRYISPCVRYNWLMFAGPFKSHTCISGSHLPFQQSPPQFFQPFSSLPYPLSFRGFSSQNTMTWTRRSQPTFQPVLGSQHGPSHISDPRSPGITENRVNPATGLWVGIANLHKAP